MLDVKLLAKLQMDVLFELFRDYVIIGGMPEVANTYIKNKNFSGKHFQITKIAKNARNRDYIGCVEWLADAGVINVCHCLNLPELPLKGNYDSLKRFLAENTAVVEDIK